MPLESLHRDKAKIHYFCITKEVPEQETKKCPKCRIDFAQDAIFFDGQQKDIEPCCLRCYGKYYGCINAGGFMDAVVRQTVKMIGEKYNIKIEI